MKTSWMFYGIGIIFCSIVFVTDKENAEEKVLERNIRIVCDKCDVPLRTEKGVTFGSSTLCGHPQEPCYTYDRVKCYTASALFSHGGKTSTVQTALNPEACYPD
ncbi:hypothetical protein E2320_007408 [Naja naja]|nr:hypothetical protein E2320_007408 [Naja naja]